MKIVSRKCNLECKTRPTLGKNLIFVVIGLRAKNNFTSTAIFVKWIIRQRGNPFNLNGKGSKS